MSQSFRKKLITVMALCMLFVLSACAGDDVSGDNPVSSAEVPVSVPSQTDVMDAIEQDLPFIGLAQTEELEHKRSDATVSNASFESGDDGWWILLSDTGAALIDDTCAFRGSRSLLLGADSEYSAKAVQYIGGLEPGYYYIEVYTLNEGNQDYCYVYGKGAQQGECVTSVPRTINEGGWVKVTVRGIEVKEDGLLEIGACSAGSSQYAHFDEFRICYEKDQETQYESLFGGAVSWLDWVEDKGGKYYFSDGQEGDALQIMAENRCNFVRLELYNNPGEYISSDGNTFPGGYKDADAIFDLAVRARDKGMKIQLSFMYSDYWGNEAIPCDWLAKTEDIRDEKEIAAILTDCLYEYTRDFMQRLADAGIYPEYVSLGNEMNGGILLPYGCTYTTASAMENFCDFMDAGYRAVKEISPDSQIVLHIACNADDMFWESRVGTGRWFFGLCEQHGVKYDIIGTSYYPFWAQSTSQYALKKALSTSDLVEWCNMMIDYFDKDILVMESGINWGTPGQLANNGAYRNIYKYTPADQRDFMYELINAIKSVRDGRCIGDLYWDPVLVRQNGVGWAVSSSGQARQNVVETTTFFDYDHVALPVLDAYRYNAVGSEKAVLFGNVCNGDGNPAAQTAILLGFGGEEYSVVTDKYGDYYVEIAAGSGVLTINGTDAAEAVLRGGDRIEYDFTAE